MDYLIKGSRITKKPFRGKEIWIQYFSHFVQKNKFQAVKDLNMKIKL